MRYRLPQSNMYTITVCLILLAALSSCQHKQTSSNQAAAIKSDTLTIIGTLTRIDGSPFNFEYSIRLHKVKGTGYSYEIGKDGVILNPSTHLNANGTFSLKVHRIFITDTAGVPSEFTLEQRGNVIQDSKGVMAVFKIDKELDTLNLDKLFGKIVFK